MAREVRHDECGPEVFDRSDLGDDGKLYVRRCGLSSGGHSVTAHTTRL